MAKKIIGGVNNTVSYNIDPVECPFREFRDNELSQELWGLGPAAYRMVLLHPQSKTSSKPHTDFVWSDDQTQPLPRSARQFLHRWVRADDLALDRWRAEVSVYEEIEGSKMSTKDMQLTHAQVLLRSSFVRHVLSACFMLERCESLPLEHQWENFNCSFGPEGWRPKYHIYSPGMKAGGGLQHKPGISKSGCYLVRLFYLGAWRCVWVSDQVPVDATDSPLLPFCPMMTRVSPPAPLKLGIKRPSTMVMSGNVYLWPLLLCKALLKLAAPDMTQDYREIEAEDEKMSQFNVLHTLTGCLDLKCVASGIDTDELWKLFTQEATIFSWDGDEETVASTIKTKSVKKPTNKEAVSNRQRSSMVSVLIKDTKEYQPFTLPGITPAHEMTLIVSMARDVPLKRPLPEPEVSPWKYYRWVDWAKRHGLYESYECPRTKFIKVNGLMKMSLAPHLLDVQSTESITHGFRQEHSKISNINTGKQKSKVTDDPGISASQANKEELREWVQYDSIQPLILEVSVLYFPSMFHYSSASLRPPGRPVTKAVPNKATECIQAPKNGPLYLQIDGPEDSKLKVSLNMIHPRVLVNCGLPLEDYIEPAYLILEEFDWFEDCKLPVAKGYVSTRGYNSVEINFRPGRHFCRIWVHSRINWHIMLISESDIIMGTRDIILAAAIHECPWASRFLTALSSAFINWIRMNRSSLNVMTFDREFFRSYQPDLEWDPAKVGYDKVFLHWMFRQALQSHLSKRLGETDYRSVTNVLRHYFRDPDFGLPPKPKPPKSLREIIALDICDCTSPETEEVNILEEQIEEQFYEEKLVVSPSTLQKLLPSSDAHVCDLATEELPCGVLKHEREKMLRKHEAATCIQAYWRGTWARKCLNSLVTYTPDVLKIIMDNAFGNMESLSALMNEFFSLYPGAKKAYSVASALSGSYGFEQHSGTSPVTSVCRWVPYFQVVFFCHVPVKVHFDIQTNLPNSTLAIFNNDTSQPLPQLFNAHITFDIAPNINGYTVMGHGTLKQRPGYSFDAHWVLTILSSIDGAFHVCDNDPEECHTLSFQPAYKLHVNEIYLPNRRNILGGILVSVTKHECISFKATSTSPDLEMVATLKITSIEGDGPEIARCKGKGEIYWPYIILEPSPSREPFSSSQAGLKRRSQASHGALLTGISSARSLKHSKTPKASPGKQYKSMTKLIKEAKAPPDPRQYSIEVTVTSGWPLNLQQWKRVEEVRNGIIATTTKVEAPPKKPARGGKQQPDRNPPAPPVSVFQPQPDDAYVELECSIGASASAIARRDDIREQRFEAARRLWEAQEPGRNLRGEQIRAQFLEEFLLVPASPSSQSIFMEEGWEETEEGKVKIEFPSGPTPVTESELLDMEGESEEEARYLLMPEQIRDKFIPLYFLPLCMKEKNDEECALLTNDMAEAAKKERHARIEAASDRMKELEQYNKLFVLERQQKRCHLLEKLFVDSQFCDELMEKVEERDGAIALETLNRALAASKKIQQLKQEQKPERKK